MKKIKLDTSLKKENEAKEEENDNDKIKEENDLIHAISVGDHEKLDKYLSSGVSVEAENLKKSRTPLIFAAAVGHAKCVETLITYGANVNARDKYNCTAVFLASAKGHYSCLKLLLEAGADCSVPVNFPPHLSTRDYSAGMTALHVAAKFNHVNCVKELISSGADCSSVDISGHTSLYGAARAGFSECVLTHLKYSRDSSFIFLQCNASSDIPLHYAVRYGMVECVRQLVRLGSNVNHMNFEGLSPLNLACRSSTRLDKDTRLQILKILVLEGNANINYTFHQVVETGDVGVKAFLCAYGADINVMNRFSVLPLIAQELNRGRNLDFIKCLVDCMLQLPHLSSMNIHFTQSHNPPASEDDAILDIPFLPKNMPFGLFRGERGMYAEFCPLLIIEHLMVNRGRINPRQDFRTIFPLRQPILNRLYNYVCDELKDCIHGPFESRMMQEMELLHKDRLLKLKQQLWYEKMASNPRTLQHCCRFSIRKCMGSNMKHAKKLPLPEKLISYLLLGQDI